MKRPRVLFVTNFCPHYRVGLFELLHERLGAEFLFFSQGGGEYWQSHLGVSMGHFPGETVAGGHNIGNKIHLNSALVRKLTSRDFDIMVKCINGRFELPASYAVARRKGSGFVLWTGMWMHPGSVFHAMSHPLAHRLYRRADAIVTYGHHVRDFVIAEGAAPDEVFVAENATDNAFYGQPVPPSAVHAFRAQHNLDPGRVVLAVSRLVHQKGLEFLIEAVGLLPPPYPTLVIVGTGVLGTTLVHLAEQRGVPIRLLGGLKPAEMPSAYAASDVFVMPSITTKTIKETWGLACNEAMNQAVPVVTTTAVGAAAGGLVADGHTGLVVPERDAPALAGALHRLLCDRALARDLGVRGRKRVQSTNYEGMVAGFEAAIECANRRRALAS